MPDDPFIPNRAEIMASVKVRIMFLNERREYDEKWITLAQLRELLEAKE